jgi:hypothetical protein
MTHTSQVPAVEPPSLKRIAMATAVAVVVASIVLVTAVLPAEFGIDPLGTGRATGLLDLYQAASGGEVEIVAEAEPADVPAERPRTYNIDKTEFKIGPKQGFEYKYRMDKGAGMVYAWKTTGRVNYDFHGDPQDRTLAVQSYEKSTGDFAAGSFTAPYSGIHGWFWENLADEEITVTITSSGFFREGVELRPKFDEAKLRTVLQQIPHEVKPAE